MLAPVREHAAEHTPAEPEATALAAHYAALADTLPYLGASSYDRDAALRARVELPNIEAVLPCRTADAESSALGWRWIRVADTRQNSRQYRSRHDRLRDRQRLLCRFGHSRPRQPYPAARPLGQLGADRRRAAWPRATCPAPSRPTPRARTSADKLAAADPGNAEWQRDLSVSWNKLGDVRRGPGRPARRPPGLHRGQEHRRQARRRRPRQRRVAARPLGQLEQARRRAPGPGRPARRPPGLHREQEHRRQARRRRPRQRRVAARPLRQLGQARRRAAWPRATCQAPSRPSPKRKNIADKLAAADPGNAQWQRDLVVSNVKLAETAAAGPQPASAATHYREALRVARELAASAASPRPTPGWSRSLSSASPPP